MKHLLSIFILFLTLVVINACNSSDKHASTLQKCTTLADESIIYARANYVKLFHYFNPDKFLESYSQVKDFDYETHRNVINTYDIAVRKIKTKDAITKSLLSSCKSLADFSKTLVDQTYPRAIAHDSEEDPLSDKFFMEINQIVKFDHKIGVFDKDKTSFKQYVKNYETAVKAYIDNYKAELPDVTN